MVYHFGCGAHFLLGADSGNAETRSRPGDGVRGFMAAQSAWDGDPTGGEIPACMRRVSAAQGPPCRRTSCLRPEGIRDATSVPGSDDGVLYRAGSQLENILPRSHCASRSHGNGAWRLLPRESLCADTGCVGLSVLYEIIFQISFRRSGNAANLCAVIFPKTGRGELAVQILCCFRCLCEYEESFHRLR